MFTRLTFWKTFAWLGFAFLSSPALAIPPPFVSDQGLAESPMIVVARWDGAPWENRSLVEGNALREHEVRTHLVVERVIRGELKPGKHPVLIGYAIGWSKKRPRVTSYMSTQMEGDADATQASLWFLHRKRSRMKEDETDYLFLESYRGVQPLELEPYYAALATKRPEEHLEKLLQSKQEAVLLRTLELVAGSDPPWLYELWSSIGDGKPLVEQRHLVDPLVENADSENVRRMALFVYLHLAGKEGLDVARAALTSDDSQMRAIAVRTLVREKDVASLDALSKAIDAIDEPFLACEIIEQLRKWNSSRVVPLLISFLQSEGLGYMDGDDLGVPALKAHVALRELTGYSFPQDVAASHKAWKAAEHVEDRTERNKLLARELPSDPAPWKASVLEQDGRLLVKVENRSRLTFTLAKRPDEVSHRYSGGRGSRSASYHDRDGRDAFKSLKPGESLQFELDEYFQDSKGKSGEYNLSYYASGKAFGLQAWLGVIKIKMQEEMKK